MAGLVTKETDRSVEAFIEAVDSPSKRADSYEIVKLIEEVTGLKPKVWGNEKVPDFLIGFGNYSYTRKGGKEVFEWFKVGFAPRKSKITIYLTFDISKQEELLAKLGKCKWGSGCLYINKLADVNTDVLKELVALTK
ncbi:MAG: DUF1801 domain-containing protein [Bacteroidota bacterium]